MKRMTTNLFAFAAGLFAMLLAAPALAGSLEQAFSDTVFKTASNMARDAYVAYGPSAQPKQFAQGASYTLCFTPDGPSCETMLIQRINKTRRNLLIQAYSFTDPEIAKAVADAHHRGVEVVVLVDKSQVSEKYTSATFLKNAGIRVLVDNEPAIAHNKVMIMDGQAVFTGSYNFTKSAQMRNTENGIIIEGDPGIIGAYTDNWNVRYRKSARY